MAKTTRATHKAQDDVLNAIARLHHDAETGSAHQEALNAIYSQTEARFGYDPGDFAPEGADTPPVVAKAERAKKG